MRPLFHAAIAALVLAGACHVARAEESCNVPESAMMPKAAITKSLEDRGYTRIRSLSVHDGCYEAKGLDRTGKRFELELNGRTGDIVNAE